MVSYHFVENAGRSVGGRAAGGAPDATALRREVEALGLEVAEIAVAVAGNRVELSGKTADQSTKEKLVLAFGNVAGIAEVEETVEAVAEPGGKVAESLFYTVAPGDTLWTIAEANYGNGKEETRILEANRPILADAAALHPGLVLRIPPLGSDQPRSD